jgi:hypothetical protein
MARITAAIALLFLTQFETIPEIRLAGKRLWGRFLAAQLKPGMPGGEASSILKHVRPIIGAGTLGSQTLVYSEQGFSVHYVTIDGKSRVSRVSLHPILDQHELSNLLRGLQGK